MHRPEHHATGQRPRCGDRPVGGEVDRVFHLGVGGREAAIAEASSEAIERAVSAGAARERVEVVEIEEVPLAYLTDPAVRIRVKAGGPLAWG